MKNGIYRGAAAAALACCAPAAHADPTHSLAEDAKAFGTRPFLRDADISPSGKKVVMLVSAAGAATIANTVDVGSSAVTRLGNTDGKAGALQFCAFAGDDHVVCRYAGVQRIGLDLAPFSRMISVNADGTKLRELAQTESDRAAYVALSGTSVIDWMPQAEGKILVQRQYVPELGGTGHLMSRTEDGLGVDIVDLDSGKSSSLEPPRNGVAAYLTDGRGNVRVETLVYPRGANGQLSGAEGYRYRLPGARDWLELGQFNLVSRAGIRPLAIDADRNVLFVLQRLGGRDALVQIALDASKATQLVAKNDQVDIDDVVRIGRGQRVIGYTYVTDRRHVSYFDPEFGKLHEALGKALNGASIDFVQASDDGQQLLIRASTDTNPGAFYVFSRPTHSMVEVARIRPELDGRSLASMQSIDVPAPDGAMIPTYLTLPPGSSGKNLPTVMLPHGGPSARDEWGFDWLAQFLAARGYAVMQPQFRGSDGFGDAWLNKNGFQNWRTSIGDITAAARYLIAKGIADPKHIAIMGWSYGGYAALQSAAVEPTLYKAAIAIAPVTDFAMAEKEAENFSDGDLIKRIIGTGPHLIEGSPLQNASKIKVPVLLIHGTMDANVSIRESQAMLSALKKAGTPADMLTFEGLDHQLDDSDARTQMLNALGEFLGRTIG